MTRPGRARVGGRYTAWQTAQAGCVGYRTCCVDSPSSPGASRRRAERRGDALIARGDLAKVATFINPWSARPSGVPSRRCSRSKSSLASSGTPSALAKKRAWCFCPLQVCPGVVPTSRGDAISQGSVSPVRVRSALTRSHLPETLRARAEGPLHRPQVVRLGYKVLPSPLDLRISGPRQAPSDPAVRS